MKAYVKPELYVESYELSQHIATCGIDINYLEDQSCIGQLDPEHWDGYNDTVFSHELACTLTTDDVESYCYTTGNDVTGRLFNS